MIKAAVLTIGDELIRGEIVDTNSAGIASRLQQIGIGVKKCLTVGDDTAEIAETLKQLIGRYRIIIVSGGLGPTGDDITREAAARALGRELLYNEEAAAKIEKIFTRRNIKFTTNNFRQAYFPEGAEILNNERGTAPGFMCQQDNTSIYILPGVPDEMERMLAAEVLPDLQKLNSGIRPLLLARYQVIGLGEAELEDRIKKIIKDYSSVHFSFLPRGGVIEVKLTCSPEKENLLSRAEKEIERKLSSYIFGRGEETLTGKIGKMLKNTSKTIATAESITGGLLGKRLTDRAGSSEYFAGGVISYSGESKIKLLGVPRELLATRGAVDSKVAELMAQGVRELLAADIGLAVTGYAGPEADGNNVGLVFGGLAGEGRQYSVRWNLTGDRKRIRWLTSQFAFNLVRKHLLEEIT